MGEVIRHPAAPPAVPLTAAADEFAEHVRFHGSGSPDTVRVYRQVLTALAEYLAGRTGCPAAAVPVDAFTAAAAESFMAHRYGAAAPAYWNRNRSILSSFARWALRRGILAVDPTAQLDQRKVSPRGDRSIPESRIDRLIESTKAVREKTLWSMLYSTAARASEILGLDVDDLDPAQRRGRIRAKGGAIEYVHWDTRTARLLPRLLSGRTAGPVFVTYHRAGAGTRAPAPVDICPTTGRARVSYERAERLFKLASVPLDPHGNGWTFHRLRHSALTHAAERGRSAPELQAKSRHRHLSTVGRYVRLGSETAARITAEDDPANRRGRK